MKFECGDLERALAISELMPEAREHLRHCAACRREYRIWHELSRAAKDLRVEWETPLLWPGIRRSIEAEGRRNISRLSASWKPWAAVAAALLLLTSVFVTRQGGRFKAPAKPAQQQLLLPGARAQFLTEQALAEVERTEAAYRRSIEKLSALAEPRLHNPVSARTMNYREKLLMLDSAISDTRSNVDGNRFNVRLRIDLAELYREKQETLKELLTGDHKN